MPSYNNTGSWGNGRLVFHAANNTVMLFIGVNGESQTWVFDGTTWTQQSPAASPSTRYRAQMAYDPVLQETVLFGGYDYHSTGNNLADTWVWDGSNWTAKTSAVSPPVLSGYGAAWHPGYQGVVIPTTGRDLWVWNGTVWRTEHTTGLDADSKVGHAYAYMTPSSKMLDIVTNKVTSLKNGVWSFETGTPYIIDLNTRPNGVFNYTDITVPAGVTVKFIRNAANTPVIWLASGNVTINGTVDVSASGFQSGPGGYDGANGLMTTGYGPGGGYAPDRMPGYYYGVYAFASI